MEELTITTTKLQEVVDITDKVQQVLLDQHIQSGLCHLFLTHTTAALTTSLPDPDNELNLIGAFELCIPHNPLPGEKSSLFHTHHHSHLPSHIISSLIGSSLVIPVKDGELLLGKLQRVVLIELNGPRDRTLVVDTGKATITLSINP